MRRASYGWRLLAILLGLAAATPVQAAGWLEKTVYMIGPRYDGVVPACDAALGTIASKFADKEAQFWNSELRIVDFDKVREVRHRPWASDTIPRRFCNAVATINDGTRRKVHYWIGEDTGMMGLSWGVEWCVVGLDRNWAYNPGCKMARP